MSDDFEFGRKYVRMTLEDRQIWHGLKLLKDEEGYTSAYRMFIAFEDDFREENVMQSLVRNSSEI